MIALEAVQSHSQQRQEAKNDERPRVLIVLRTLIVLVFFGYKNNEEFVVMFLRVQVSSSIYIDFN